MKQADRIVIEVVLLLLAASVLTGCVVYPFYPGRPAAVIVPAPGPVLAPAPGPGPVPLPPPRVVIP